MMRWRMCGLLVLALGHARADEIPTVALTVEPRAVAEPTLRYPLLPELRETQSGNAVLNYYRAFSPEWVNVFNRDQMATKISAGLTRPLGELRKDADLGWLRSSSPLQEFDRAARKSYCDWDLVARVRESGINTLLPDLQMLRQYGTALSLRARLEIADGDWEAASRTLATQMQFGRHLAEGPTVIQLMVGVAVSRAEMKQLETWITQPGSPNLYWPLTRLPQTLFSTRHGWEGERVMVDQIIPGGRECLYHPERAKALPRYDAAAIRQWLTVLSEKPLPLWEEAMVVAKLQPEARALLASLGWSAEQIAALSPLQAMMLHQLYHCDRLFDRYLQLEELPLSERLPLIGQTHAALQAEMAPDPVRFWFSKHLLSATNRALLSVTRIDREIAALRTVELLRHYAGKHGGELPATLVSVDGMPVPRDALTERPFAYELRDGTATITMDAPPGEPKMSGFRYSVTVKK